MKTTRKFRTMLSLITVGLWAGSVGAQNSDGYAESFESHGIGLAITNVAGWEATEESFIVATNYSANYAGGDYPIPGGHTKVLRVENNVTNAIVAGDQGVTNWVDIVLKPTISDDTPALSSVEGAAVACFFNTNMNLVIYYATGSLAYDWLEITEHPSLPIGSNDWIRLTIAMNLADGDDFDDVARFYKIYLNGTVVTNASAYMSPSSTSDTGGSWFQSGAPIVRTAPITNVVIKGTGYIDDLVVTNSLTLTAAGPAEPSYIESVEVSNVLMYGQTVAAAGVYGTATNAAGSNVVGQILFDDAAVVPTVGTNRYAVTFIPYSSAQYLTATGSVDVVTEASTPAVTWPPANELTEGETLGDASLSGGSASNAYNGAVVGGTFSFVDPLSTEPPVGTKGYDVVFTPTDGTSYLSVTGSVDVIVGAALTTTANGTPISWYGLFGLTPAGEGVGTYDELDALDSDDDGVVNWEEYIAGTNPNNPLSVFKLVHVSGTIPNLTLRWIGGTNGPVTPYIVEGATSLVGTTIGWMNITNSTRVEGTNTWNGTSGSSMLFFRVLATP